jgi:hypothetical protein
MSTQRKDMFQETISLSLTHTFHDIIRIIKTALLSDSLVNDLNRVQVLVIASRDAFEVKDELPTLSFSIFTPVKALVEAVGCHSFLNCINVPQLIILSKDNEC